MAQLGTPSQVFQKIYGYSSEDFDSLESFLFDFHSRFPGCSMNEVMRQSNRPLLKLKNTEEAYRYIGQDPQYADFKNILSRIWAMRDRLIVVRMAAAGDPPITPVLLHVESPDTARLQTPKPCRCRRKPWPSPVALCQEGLPSSGQNI